MKPGCANIFAAKEWFKVLHTSSRSQMAVMKLGPGQSSGPEPEAHQRSDQVLLLVQGSLTAVIDGHRSTLHEGDAVLIPAGLKHQFTNDGHAPAVTFNVYSPPEYPPDE